MKKLFTDEQKQYILDNYEKMKYKDIAKNLGTEFTATQITGWIHNQKLKKTNRSMYSFNDKFYIINNYKIKTYKEIADDLRFSERQIRHFVNHYLENKTRKFNKRYFQYIDTPIKAYYLGYIYADGYITFNKEARNYEFGMQLQKRDIDILIDLKNEIGNSHKMSYSHFEGVVHKNKVVSICDEVRLRIYSVDIVKDLINHNIVPNKTYQDIFPELDNYFLDFLRGYIDGDGCIHITKKGYLVIHITSYGRKALDYICKRLKDEYNINSYVYEENPQKYRLYINGFEGMRLLDLLYYDDNIQKLDRKYQKYLLLKQQGSPYQK